MQIMSFYKNMLNFFYPILMIYRILWIIYFYRRILLKFYRWFWSNMHFKNIYPVYLNIYGNMVCIILCAAASVIKYWAYTLLTLYKDRSAPMSYSYNSTRNFFVTMNQDLGWLISFVSVLISGEIIALILWKIFERSLGMII